jgi:hypothetical protein
MFSIRFLSHLYVLGSQPNLLDKNSNEQEDFHVQLPSSFNFKLQPVDLVKLKSIRTKKINKKEARLYEAMGLPIETDKTTNKKKIFISKTNKTNLVNNSKSNYKKTKFLTKIVHVYIKFF